MDANKANFVICISLIAGVMYFLFRMEGCAREDAILGRDNERRQVEVQAEAVKAAERVMMEWVMR